jgi:peptidoglycan/xylan/chitin deacetylase (PgdA/CDA1 family)
VREQGLPVLLYHSVADSVDPRFAEWAVTPAQFAAHMDLLRSEGYRTVTVRELALGARAAAADRTVVITFDDGFEDFYTAAWPHLERNGLTATVFITSGNVGSTATWLGRQGEGDRPLMSWAQIAEISAAGIECGAHGHTHVQLDTVPPSRARQEIERSRDALAAATGPVSSFAYPHGYHTRRVRRAVRRAGFARACAVGDGLAAASGDPYAIARVIVRRATSVDDLARILDGPRPVARPRPIRRAAWRVARRCGAEPLVEWTGRRFGNA